MPKEPHSTKSHLPLSKAPYIQEPDIYYRKTFVSSPTRALDAHYIDCHTTSHEHNQGVHHLPKEPCSTHTRALDTPKKSPMWILTAKRATLHSHKSPRHTQKSPIYTMTATQQRAQPTSTSPAKRATLHFSKEPHSTFKKAPGTRTLHTYNSREPHVWAGYGQ